MDALTQYFGPHLDQVYSSPCNSLITQHFRELLHRASRLVNPHN
jgi:hypothetical protein